MLNGQGLPCPHVILELDVDTAERATEALWARLGALASPCLISQAPAVLARLKEGRGGLADGVAIPHARLPQISVPVSAFARLARPVAFDALDGRPCDLIYMLLSPLSPEGAHLKALARASRYFRREPVRRALRNASGREALCAVFARPAAQAA